jgi:hypothetical protein
MEKDPSMGFGLPEFDGRLPVGQPHGQREYFAAGTAARNVQFQRRALVGAQAGIEIGGDLVVVRAISGHPVFLTGNCSPKHLIQRFILHVAPLDK